MKYGGGVIERPLAFPSSRAAIRLVASKTANSVNCGIVETDRTICRAIALRIPTTLMRRSPSVDGAAVVGDDAAASDDAAAGEAAAASTSARVIRPHGQLPVRCVRPTPISLASWRTKGAARTSALLSVTAGAVRALRRMPGPGAPGPYPTRVPGVASAWVASAAVIVTSGSPTATDSPGRAWSL